MQVYLVGGAVRDALLGLAVKERDWVVVGGTREELLRLNFREVGRDFPVFLHPELWPDSSARCRPVIADSRWNSDPRSRSKRISRAAT